MRTSKEKYYYLLINKTTIAGTTGDFSEDPNLLYVLVGARGGVLEGAWGLREAAAK